MDAGKILDDFRSGVITREQALERLNILPYEDIGFAKLDHHRQLRRGAWRPCSAPAKPRNRSA